MVPIQTQGISARICMLSSHRAAVFGNRITGYTTAFIAGSGPSERSAHVRPGKKFLVGRQKGQITRPKVSKICTA